MANTPESNNYSYEQDAAHYASTDADRLQEPHVAELVGALKNYIKPSSKARILDIGCGTGRYEFALQDSGAEVAGIDPDTEMLAIAKDRFPDLQFDLAFADSIPHETSSFDAAFSIGVFAEHTPLTPAILSEISRVLRPGAHLFFTTRQRRSRGGQLAALVNVVTLGRLGQLNDRMKRTHWMPNSKVEKLLENTGFKVESVTTWQVPYMPWPHSIIKARNGVFE